MKPNKGTNTRLHRAQLEAVGVELPKVKEPRPEPKPLRRAGSKGKVDKTARPRQVHAPSPPKVTVTSSRSNTNPREVTIISGPIEGQTK